MKKPITQVLVDESDNILLSEDMMIRLYGTTEAPDQYVACRIGAFIQTESVLIILIDKSTPNHNIIRNVRFTNGDIIKYKLMISDEIHTIKLNLDEIFTEYKLEDPYGNSLLVPIETNIADQNHLIEYSTTDVPFGSYSGVLTIIDKESMYIDRSEEFYSNIVKVPISRVLNIFSIS